MPQKPWSYPLLRWAGSKRQVLPELLSRVPRDFRTYFEPFAGSACLFFALHPESAVLGDINSDLLDCYKVIRQHPRLLARLARAIEVSKQQYYATRAAAVDGLGELELAARFIYLNRFCFNAVYRTDKNGRFNVPMGSRTGSIPPEYRFYRCAVALRSATLVLGDFGTAVDAATARDFVYLDPPYANSTGPRAGEYGPGCFRSVDVPRLIDTLRALDSRGVRFLLSYADCSTLRAALPADWKVEKLTVRRHVSGFSAFRGEVTELLVSNYR
jgi:DNA adenine methylase